MASVRLDPAVPPFQVGSVVNVYQGNLDFFGPGQPPGVVKAGPFTVQPDGSVTVTGLDDNARYILAAQVGGAWRYIRFGTPPPAGVTTGGPTVAAIPEAGIIVGTSPVTILGANAYRLDYGIFNDYDSDGPVLYLSLGGVAAVGKGIRIGPSSSWPPEDKGVVWKGSVSIVSDTPGTNVPYYEV